MKKLIAMILALAAVFSLTACGGDAENSGETQVQDATGGANAVVIPEEDTEPQETTPEETKPLTPPTEEEVAALQEYAKVLAALKEYEETGKVTVAGESKEPTNEQIKQYYTIVANAVVVDKFAGSEYAAEYDIEWDRQTVLKNFAVLENVLVGYSLNGDMSTAEAYGKEWEYHSSGKLLMIKPQGMVSGKNVPISSVGMNYYWPVENDPVEFSSSVNYSFDDSGKITAVKYSSFANGVAFYDDAGRMEKIRVTVQHPEKGAKEFDINYRYNEQGQVVEIKTFAYFNVWVQEIDQIRNQMVYTYDYDEKGNLTRAESKLVSIADPDDYTWRTVRQYTYAPDGKQITAVETIQYENGNTCTDQLTYKLDAAGNKESLSVVSGNWVDSNGAVIKNRETETGTYEFIYGDIYIYKPAE